MKAFIFILLCSFIANIGNTQQRILRGQVLSIDTIQSQKPGNQSQELVIYSDGIPGASICLLNSLSDQQKGNICKYGTITDFDGAFQISIPAELTQEYRYIELTYRGRLPLVAELNDRAYDTVNVFLLMPDSVKHLFPIDSDSASVDKTIPVYKPAIYLYPTRNKTAVSIKHAFKGTIGTTYPAYGNGWEVIADTNGNLYNTQDKRQYEYLFWDGKVRFPDEHFKFKSGFVVPKEESQAFLWEKLALIGLNNKEINDFVVYWLPQLEQNEQNFIHFRINDDIDHSSVLTVTPQPDSWIRLFMEFKSVPAGFNIAPQQLQSYPRKGFTLVEWGGAKLEEVLQVQ